MKFHKRQAVLTRQRAIGALLIALLLPQPGVAAQPEKTSMQLLDRVLAVREALIDQGASRDAAFITVWDFDGTILDGDCSEGLARNGEVVYAGLAELAIDNGLSPLYSNKGGFEAFWHDYRLLDERMGHWIAYPFIVQMLRGGSVDALVELAEHTFENVYKPHYFAGSMYILEGLQQAGIEVHIISASAERFVEGAAKTLNIHPDFIHGIRVIEKDGLMTEELVYPVTWNEGKRKHLEAVLAARAAANPGREIYVIGGFGNSYNTDGPFMAWIAKQNLPAGKPVVAMINGGDTPQDYSGLFTEIAQAATVK